MEPIIIRQVKTRNGVVQGRQYLDISTSGKKSQKSPHSDGGAHGLCSWELGKMLEWDTRLGLSL